MICRAQIRRMREFSNGQEVCIHNFSVGSRWISGVIVNSSGPLAWLIKLEDGKTVIRHADHIQNRYVQNNDKTFQEFEKIEISRLYCHAQSKQFSSNNRTNRTNTRH